MRNPLVWGPVDSDRGNDMGRLGEKFLVFVAGVEGSGTTILGKLLSIPDFAVALGGGYVSPTPLGYDTGSVRARLNAFTRVLWRHSNPPLGANKRRILKEIGALPVAGVFSHVIYKRSYPFEDVRHFPNLADLDKIANNVRVVVSRRNPLENAASILRRGFVDTLKASIERVARAYRILGLQLEKFDKDRVHVVDYETLISDSFATIGGLEAFLNFPNGTLNNHRSLISTPTKASQDILRKFETTEPQEIGYLKSIKIF